MIPRSRVGTGRTSTSTVSEAERPDILSVIVKVMFSEPIKSGELKVTILPLIWTLMLTFPETLKVQELISVQVIKGVKSTVRVSP
ncbi:MAG: hypothetical protein BWY18_00618 [Candidatus Cloacimonetes bacterium ADurb.Bin211]|nr:MAG: hypothetical protein BWY18_00618 [Candidatus Cloacimonetes bacterium ADurb.Bin211]